jgi:hypothetical protein
MTLKPIKASLFGTDQPSHAQTRKICIADCADYTTLHQRVVSVFPEVAASRKKVALSYIDADHDEVQLDPHDDFFDFKRTAEKLQVRFL